MPHNKFIRKYKIAKYCSIFCFTVNGKHYEWQLSDGHQWLPIDHDHVIETHYCQPGAKGITINFIHTSVLLLKRKGGI